MLQVFDSCADSRKPLQPVEIEIVSIEYGVDDGKALVVYEGDPQVYDSGKILTIVYRRNENDPDAIENQIIDSDDKEDVLFDALYQVIPTSIPFFYPTITRVTLETVEGNLTAAITE